MDRLSRVSCSPRGRGWREWDSLSLVSLLSPPPPPPDTQATVRQVRSFTDIMLLTFASCLVRKSTKANPLWVPVPDSFFGSLKVLISPNVLRRRDEVEVNLLLCSLHLSGLVVQCC